MRKPRYTSSRYLSFVAACRWQANRQWLYPELVDDHPERVEQAYRLKENPKAFIKWLGEKYDLTSMDDPWMRP